MSNKRIELSGTVHVRFADENLFEDNVTGKVTDEWFTHMAHKYEVEKAKIKAKFINNKKIACLTGRLLRRFVKENLFINGCNNAKNSTLKTVPK